MNEHQLKMIANLPKEKQDFISKQLEIHADATDFMKGNMFMPCDGRCYHCNKDIITNALANGNDGSESITGCPFCFRSYCD